MFGKNMIKIVKIHCSRKNNVLNTQKTIKLTMKINQNYKINSKNRK